MDLLSARKPRMRFLILGIMAAAWLWGGSGPSVAEGKESFAQWLEGLRKEAKTKGISKATLDRALSGLRPLPWILRRDRNQPEFKLTLEEYLARTITTRRVNRGQEKMQENREILEALHHRYGVEPQVLVALWGIETSYGERTGHYPVIQALATLAYDARRSAFFRRELLEALHILDEGHITPERMRGSWAGAMGQIQFMPSSFRHYGVDHEGDGRIDIWENPGDALT